jgi:hypothetical protein
LLIKGDCKQIEKPPLKRFNVIYLYFFNNKKTLKACGYAAQKSKEPLSQFEFERREP